MSSSPQDVERIVTAPEFVRYVQEVAPERVAEVIEAQRAIADVRAAK